MGDPKDKEGVVSPGVEVIQALEDMSAKTGQVPIPEVRRIDSGVNADRRDWARQISGVVAKDLKDAGHSRPNYVFYLASGDDAAAAIATLDASDYFLVSVEPFVRLSRRGKLVMPKQIVEPDDVTTLSPTKTVTARSSAFGLAVPMLERLYAFYPDMQVKNIEYFVDGRGRVHGLINIKLPGRDPEEKKIVYMQGDFNFKDGSYGFNFGKGGQIDWGFIDGAVIKASDTCVGSLSNSVALIDTLKSNGGVIVLGEDSFGIESGLFMGPGGRHIQGDADVVLHKGVPFSYGGGMKVIMFKEPVRPTEAVPPRPARSVATYDIDYADARDIGSLRAILKQWVEKDIEDETIDRFGKSMMRGTHMFLIARDEDKNTIGFMGYGQPRAEIRKLARTSDPTELTDIFVDNDNRGRGIGRSLIQELETDAREQGATEILVASGPKLKKTAWGFYDKLPGFKRVGYLKDYFGEGRDAQVWSKVIQGPPKGGGEKVAPSPPRGEGGGEGGSDLNTLSIFPPFDVIGRMLRPVGDWFVRAARVMLGGKNESVLEMLSADRAATPPSLEDLLATLPVRNIIDLMSGDLRDGNMIKRHIPQFDTNFYFSVTSSTDIHNGRLDEVSRDANVILLLAHGAGTPSANGASFIAEINTLNKHGIAAISVDLPFHGGPKGEEFYTGEGLANWVASITQYLRDKYPGKKILLAGHSFGPDVILETVTRHPNAADGIAGFSMVSPLIPEIAEHYKEHTLSLLDQEHAETLAEGELFQMVLDRGGFTFAKRPAPPIPMLIVNGEQEQWLPDPYQMQALLKDLYPNMDVRVVPGLDHHGCFRTVVQNMGEDVRRIAFGDSGINPPGKETRFFIWSIVNFVTEHFGPIVSLAPQESVKKLTDVQTAHMLQERNDAFRALVQPAGDILTDGGAKKALSLWNSFKQTKLSEVVRGITGTYSDFYREHHPLIDDLLGKLERFETLSKGQKTRTLQDRNLILNKLRSYLARLEETSGSHEDAKATNEGVSEWHQRTYEVLKVAMAEHISGSLRGKGKERRISADAARKAGLGRLKEVRDEMNLFARNVISIFDDLDLVRPFRVFDGTQKVIAVTNLQLVGPKSLTKDWGAEQVAASYERRSDRKTVSAEGTALLQLSVELGIQDIKELYYFTLDGAGRKEYVPWDKAQAEGWNDIGAEITFVDSDGRPKVLELISGDVSAPTDGQLAYLSGHKDSAVFAGEGLDGIEARPAAVRMWREFLRASGTDIVTVDRRPNQWKGTMPSRRPPAFFDQSALQKYGEETPFYMGDYQTILPAWRRGATREGVQEYYDGLMAELRFTRGGTLGSPSAPVVNENVVYRLGSAKELDPARPVETATVNELAAPITELPKPDPEGTPSPLVGEGRGEGDEKSLVRRFIDDEDGFIVPANWSWKKIGERLTRAARSVFGVGETPNFARPVEEPTGVEPSITELPKPDPKADPKADLKMSVEKLFYPRELFDGGKVVFLGGWAESFRDGPINRVREAILKKGLSPQIDVVDLKSKEREQAELRWAMTEVLMFEPSEVSYHQKDINEYAQGREGLASVIYVIYPPPGDPPDFLSTALKLAKPGGSIVFVTEDTQSVRSVEKILGEAGVKFIGWDDFGSKLLPTTAFSWSPLESVHIRLITMPERKEALDPAEAAPKAGETEVPAVRIDKNHPGPFNIEGYGPMTWGQIHGVLSEIAEPIPGLIFEILRQIPGPSSALTENSFKLAMAIMRTEGLPSYIYIAAVEARFDVDLYCRIARSFVENREWPAVKRLHDAIYGYLEVRARIAGKGAMAGYFDVDDGTYEQGLILGAAAIEYKRVLADAIAKENWDDVRAVLRLVDRYYHATESVPGFIDIVEKGSFQAMPADIIGSIAQKHQVLKTAERFWERLIAHSDTGELDRVLRQIGDDEHKMRRFLYIMADKMEIGTLNGVTRQLGIHKKTRTLSAGELDVLARSLLNEWKELKAKVKAGYLEKDISDHVFKPDRLPSSFVDERAADPARAAETAPQITELPKSDPKTEGPTPASEPASPIT